MRLAFYLKDKMYVFRVRCVLILRLDKILFITLTA